MPCPRRRPRCPSIRSSTLFRFAANGPKCPASYRSRIGSPDSCRKYASFWVSSRVNRYARPRYCCISLTNSARAGVIAGRRRPRRSGETACAQDRNQLLPSRGSPFRLGVFHRRLGGCRGGLDRPAAMAPPAVGLLLQAAGARRTRPPDRPARRAPRLPQLQRRRPHRARGDPRDPRYTRPRRLLGATKSAVPQQRAHPQVGRRPRASLPRRARLEPGAGSRRPHPIRARR